MRKGKSEKAKDEKAEVNGQAGKTGKGGAPIPHRASKIKGYLCSHCQPLAVQDMAFDTATQHGCLKELMQNITISDTHYG